MTTIDALSLQGIRSYSPKHPQMIKFQKPLTIILGTNGSGKTTIIEALRLASTGEFPPGTEKGKLFVHDPKIIGQSEVKGQVRLQFKTPNKKTMLAIRSMQVTQKRKTTTFKQLDATIQTRGDDGEMKSNGHKCSEMNTLVPALMGVSRAVLDSVIFCHQEDVNWPLGTGRVLKDRFDDIFSSTRYTKALKTMKEVKKKQDLEIKSHEGFVKLNQEHKDHADKLVADLEFENKKISKLDDRINEKQDEIDHINEQLEQYEDQIDAIKSLTEKINTLKAQRRATKKVAEEYASKIREQYDESDEEIKQLLEGFENDLENLQEDVASTKEKLENNELQSKKLSTKYQTVSNQKHLLENEKRNHERRVREITTEIESISAQHSIEMPSQSDPDWVLKFAGNLESNITTMEKDLNELKSKHSDELLALKDKVMSVKQEIRSQDQVITKSKKSLKSIGGNMTKLQKQIEESGLDEDTLNTQRTSVEKKKSLFDELNESDRGEQIESQISQVKQDISDTNSQISDIGSQLQKRKAEQEAAFRLEQTRKELTTLQESFQTSYAEIQFTLKSLNDDKDVPAEECSHFLEKKVLKKLGKESSRLQNQLSKEERDLASVVTRISSNESATKNLNKKLAQQKQKLEDNMVDMDNYDETVKKAEEEAEYALNDYSITKAMSDMADKFKKHANHKHNCPTCERQLDSDELKTFVLLQEKKMQNAPSLLKSKSEAKDESEKRVRSLRLLKPVIAEIKNITDKQLVKHEEQAKELEEEKTDLEEQVETIKTQINELKEKENDARNILPASAKIQELLSQIKSKESLVESEEAKLKAIASEGKDFNELKQEQEQLQSKLEELNNQLDSLRKEKEEVDTKLQQLEREWRNEEKILSDLERDYQNQKHMEENLNKLTSERDALQKDITTAEDAKPALEEKLTQLNQEVNAKQEEQQKSESTIATQLSNLNKAQSRIHATVEEIKRYTNENKEDALQTAIETENKLSIRKEDIENACKKLRDEIKNTEGIISKKNDLRRNIEDNIVYREKLEYVRNVEKKITSYKERLSRLGGGVEIDESAIKRMREERNELASIKSKAEGSRATHATRLKQIKKDLSNSKYKHAENKYRKALIELTTTRLASEDLMKYHKALENALLKYHSMKMDEINEIIKELWMKTYRGHDIDYVAIRAEPVGSSLKRTYNYRVVMRKRDVELDMKGRCSAGQKVLASLIVRLALAEAFCVECGVLALDEPTVSLDKDNIQSLAEALQVIINERKDQQHFQLVIITHDEEFVQRLGRSDLVESFYRVSKTPQGYSEISLERFTQG